MPKQSPSVQIGEKVILIQFESFYDGRSDYTMERIERERKWERFRVTIVPNKSGPGFTDLQSVFLNNPKWASECGVTLEEAQAALTAHNLEAFDRDVRSIVEDGLLAFTDDQAVAARAVELGLIAAPDTLPSEEPTQASLSLG